MHITQHDKNAIDKNWNLNQNVSVCIKLHCIKVREISVLLGRNTHRAINLAKLVFSNITWDQAVLFPFLFGRRGEKDFFPLSAKKRKNARSQVILNTAPQVKPCRAGLETRWVTHRKYRREGPYFNRSFLLLLFCVFCGVTKSICLKPAHDKIASDGVSKRVNFQSSSI